MTSRAFIGVETANGWPDPDAFVVFSLPECSADEGADERSANLTQRQQEVLTMVLAGHQSPWV